MIGVNEEKKQSIIKLLKKEFHGESTGHDWYHIDRVRKVAATICEKEGGNLFVVELGALLHDIADHKFVADADVVAVERTREILAEHEVDGDTIEQVVHIVKNCSFKGGLENKMKSLEGRIVQDADRLDAIGAIGIARTFAFGGKVGNPIYDPEVDPTVFTSAEEYVKNRTHTINHFYEKLLKLKEGMNTETGKRMAYERHHYMEGFLKQFYKEWEGEG